jgi:peptidoglycan/xylan/chitin deacetylase (PgdA/CDA1 family)
MEQKQKNNVKKLVLFIVALIILAILSFIIYEVATVHNKYYIGEKNLQIPIFVYHDLVENESEIEFDYMQTTVETFEKQITGLMKLGYEPISYEDLVEYYNGEKEISKWSFLITFDDGYTGVYKYAYEIAKKYNIPMTSFLVDNTVGKEGCYNWEQAKEMYDSGLIKIYSHGLEHANYDTKEAEELVKETNQAYESLTTNLHDEEILKVFTYPCGLYTEEELEQMKEAGYIQNLTDNRINLSDKLNLYGLHRCYPLSDSVFKILVKINYRTIRYQ